MATYTGAEFKSLIESYYSSPSDIALLETQLAAFYGATEVVSDETILDRDVTGNLIDMTLYVADGGAQLAVLESQSDQSATFVIPEDATYDHLLVRADGLKVIGNSHANLIVGNDSLDVILGGGAGNDTIIAAGGDDVLDGGTGDDQMSGGAGDDLYIVDSIGDVVTEALDSGTDTVNVSFSYTLGEHLENLQLGGSAAINGTGNDGDNLLTGNNAANVLTGGLGNDTLNGGLGNDTLIGGEGDDTYVINAAGDVVTESANEGIDTVQVQFAVKGATYTLADNIENAVVNSGVNLNLTGNTLDNMLTGNAAANKLNGGAGNDTLNGAAGADTMAGGAGDDTFFVDSTKDVVSEGLNQGEDTVHSTVTFTLGANIENLTLLGSANANATGNTLANTITGNEGNNVLNGGAGVDTMVGGTGNDTYVVDSEDDEITELMDEGTDQINIAIAAAGGTYTLGDHIENASLISKVAGNIVGNDLDNLLKGNAAANALTGNEGNDTLDGGAGNDTLTGGLGNDTYVINTLSDVVVEAVDEGNDTIQSTINFNLASVENVENITLLGKAISATGDDGDNVLTGNNAANTLTGNAGNDTLDGGLGNDKLFGGTGDDTYVVNAVGDVVTELEDEGTDTVQSAITYTLGNHVENLTLLGSANINATGNALDNSIVGNAGNNVLNGMAGVDSLAGGLGNDTYIVDTDDTVTEAMDEGVDTIQADFSYVLGANLENLTLTGTSDLDGTGNELDNLLLGNAGANVLVGNAGNDTLNGGAGDDEMSGGEGDDTYAIDTAGDVVTELADEGNDSVDVGIALAGGSYTLGANLENATITHKLAFNLTGNELDNRLTGNAAVNVLTGGLGNDTLVGGGGADTLVGGAGDDTYEVNTMAAVITEAADEGMDTVISTAAGTYVLGANIENLTLGGAAAINGTGNALANTITGNTAANKLNGEDGNDTINGADGNDSLTGGAGDDSLSGGNDNDTLDGGDGVDRLFGGAGNDLLKGGAGNDHLDGGGGDDVLDGGEGNDSLIGSSGNDTLKGGDGNDTLNGGANDDRIEGGDGDDLLIGDFGADILIGGAGNDTIQGRLTTGASEVFGSTVSGGAGSDFIRVWGGGVNNGGVITRAVNRIDADDAKDKLTFGNDTVIIATAASSSTQPISFINTYRGDDTITAGNGDNTINADAADDTVGGADLVTVGNGKNVINTGAGNDAINIGTGLNTIDAGSGNDVITKVYSAGNLGSLSSYDSFKGVKLNAGAGDDVVDFATAESSGTVGVAADFSGAKDTIDGGAGNDSILSGQGNDSVLGGTGDDTIDAGGGNDIVKGGDGADSLMGGAGNDTIAGDAGNDIISGGAGSDLLTGGAGSDVFVIGDDGSGLDIISDFGVGDTLLIDGHAGGDSDFTIADFEAAMFPDPAIKGVYLSFADGGSVLLKNVNLNDLFFDDATDTFSINKGNGNLDELFA